VLGGTALLTLAVELLAESAPAALPCLLTAIQQLISGQSDDLLLESAPDAQLAEVLRMAAGKTGALLSCAAAVGAVAAGAPARPVTALADYGRDLGMAFQLVDDILGIDGDPAATGKSASSDVRAGKRSAPIVAALQSGTEAATRLRKLLADGPPSRDADVAQAADLVHEAGGIAWARRAATGYAARACGHLDAAALRPGPAADLVALAHFVLARDR
jgi:geranylgeranyl diphosphate synthase type I